MKTAEKSANGSFFRDSVQSHYRAESCEEEEEVKEIPEGYNRVYRELAGVLKNDRLVHAVWKHYAGVSVSFPKSPYSREYTRKYVEKAMETERPAGIARKTGLTERRVRQIISEIRREKKEVRTDRGGIGGH